MDPTTLSFSVLKNIEPDYNRISSVPRMFFQHNQDSSPERYYNTWRDDTFSLNDSHYLDRYICPKGDREKMPSPIESPPSYLTKEQDHFHLLTTSLLESARAKLTDPFHSIKSFFDQLLATRPLD